ncbi:TAFII28-domain-containing protein [Pisolithus orientalis]|nr:TAFII28-domain-containing protein [Pisolithus orientalis]KAI6008791.1 TAFII28-domain-containing protein [Pisolithus orientalis]
MAYPNTPFIQMTPGPSAPSTPISAPRGRGTGAKRGRKPRGAFPNVASDTGRATPQQPQASSSAFTPLQWATPAATASPSAAEIILATEKTVTAGTVPAAGNPAVAITKPEGGDDDGEDEILPAMADDDYSAQLSWQSESKDNLKVLMDNFSAAQYDRFEAYRRHALPKQAIRRVIQQTTGQQVSQPVAQIIAGFAKVFVGEIVEKGRAVQARRGESGPLSPDHLREAYRLYQAEAGRVGSARPGRGRRLFHR